MRYYSSTFVATTIVGAITSTATTVTVKALSGAPSDTPWTIVIDGDNDNKELADVTGVSDKVLTLTRGVAGTTAIAHEDGASVDHDSSHRDFQEPQTHINDDSAVHGVTGDVVGTSDTQTLTNKTIDGDNNTLSNIAQSAVKDLGTDLDAKLGNPSTAWAKGSLLLGTGDGTYDTATVGDDGTVLTADSTAADGVSWSTPSYVPLAVTSYNPSDGATKNVAHNIYLKPTTVLDSTNLKVTFTAPASGSVLARLTGFPSSTGSGGAWGLADTDSPTDWVGSPAMVAGVNSMVSVAIVLTGLSGSVTLYWAAAVYGGSGDDSSTVLEAGGSLGASYKGPATMEIWAVS